MSNTVRYRDPLRLGSKSRWATQAFDCSSPAFRQCGPRPKPQRPCDLGQVVKDSVFYRLWRSDGQPAPNIQPREGVEFVCCVVSQIHQGTNRCMQPILWQFQEVYQGCNGFNTFLPRGFSGTTLGGDVPNTFSASRGSNTNNGGWFKSMSRM